MKILRNLLFALFCIGTLFCGVDFAVAESSSGSTVRVLADVPGMDCEAEEDKDGNQLDTYKCTVPKGTAGVTSMLGGIIKWFTYLALLCAVMFVLYSGIMYSMAGIDESMKSEAKKRITGTLLGIILLLLSGAFLQLVAPWVYK